MHTIAKPDSSADVRDEALSLARLSCNLRHDSESGVLSGRDISVHHFC